MKFLALGLLVACNTSAPTTSTYEGYDPTADVASSATSSTSSSADAVNAARAAAVVQPWFADHTKTLIGFTAPSIGRIVANGVEPGLASANAMCAELGDAHMCAYDEIKKAAAANEFASAPAGRTFWLDLDPKIPDRNCDGYNYPTGDKKSGVYAKVVTQASGNGVQYAIHDKVPFDEACLRDASVCPSVIPTGYECNVARSIPCCNN